MIKKQGIASILILAGLAIAVIAIGVVVPRLGGRNYFNQPIRPPKITTSPSPADQELKTFQSENFKMKIQIPSAFDIKDEQVIINLLSPEGQVTVVKNGTNFSNLQDYLASYDQKRKLIASDIKKLTINGYESVSRVVNFPDEKVKQKSYYIYVDNSVYIFSSRAQSLYPELDQIAQSFRYTP